jgi:hypothetical protein
MKPDLRIDQTSFLVSTGVLTLTNSSAVLVSLLSPKIESTDRFGTGLSIEAIPASPELLQTQQNQNLTDAFVQRLESLADQSAGAVNRSASKI